jgi:hypothetical protein
VAIANRTSRAPGPLLCAADVLQDHLYHHRCANHRPPSPVDSRILAQGPGSRDMIYQETRYRPRGLLIRIPIRGGYPGTACSVGSRTCVYSICGFILKKAYLSILVINIAKYIATYIDLSHQQGNFKLHPTLAILWHITSRVQGSQGIWY